MATNDAKDYEAFSGRVEPVLDFEEDEQQDDPKELHLWDMFKSNDQASQQSPISPAYRPRDPLQREHLSKAADDTVQRGRTAGLPEIDHFKPSPKAIVRPMPPSIPSHIRTTNPHVSNFQGPSTNQANANIDTSNSPRDAVAAYQRLLRERDEVSHDRNKLRAWRTLMADTQYEMAPRLLAREAQRSVVGDHGDSDGLLSQELYVEELKLEKVKGRVEDELAKVKETGAGSGGNGSHFS